MENNLDPQIWKYHTSNNRFKSANLDLLDYSSDNDSKSIIDFDDEYSEVSNLYGKKHKKIIKEKNKDEERMKEQFEEDQDYYEFTDMNIQNNTIERKIINENLKQLMEIDTNNKQGIIDILMQDNLIQKKPKNKSEFLLEKNKKKYNYVQSKSKKEFSNSKQNLYGRKGYLIEAKEGDPEFIKDINRAGYLLKDQILETNDSIAKLLFDESSASPHSKKLISRKEIGEKVKKTLEKRKKNLEKIEAEMYEEQKAEETFAPIINHRKNDNRRNLDIFLRDQNNFQKRVEQKRHNLYLRSESEKKLLFVGHPNINKNSEEMAKKRISDKNVYIRLYKAQSKNKDNDNEKKNLEEKEKENEQKLMKKKLKNNRYSHIKSKINISQKISGDICLNKSKNNIKEKEETKDKDKYLRKRNKSAIFTELNKKLLDIKDLPSNKMLWNLFNKKLEDSLKYLNLQNDEEIDENNYHHLLFSLGMITYESDKKAKKENKSEIKEREKKEDNIKEKNEEKDKKDENKKEIEENINKDEIKKEMEENINQKEENKIEQEENINEDKNENIKEKVENKNIIEKEEIKNKEEKNNNEIIQVQEEINPQFLSENSLKLEEDNIVKNSFNLLNIHKDKNKILINDVRCFLIFVLNIQNYEFFNQFKLNHTSEELKELFPSDKFKKEDLPELIIKKQNEELLSQIDKSNPKNTKYFNVSKDDKIIFTLDKSKFIKKDFSILSLNYRNHKKKIKEEKIIHYLKKKCPFKPTINENSEKIYQKNKDKIYMATNETCTTNSQGKKSNMEYIERLLLLDKKKIAENQKIKEELEKIRKKECTFKPNINTAYPFMKKQKKKKNDEKNDKNKKNKNRFDQLYEEGKQKMKLKRDRPKDEIDIEEQGNECTFTPDIYSLTQQKIPETKFANDIYNEKEYKYLYERLKHGRLERMVKESNNNRFGLNNELKQFVKDNKEFNFLQNQAYFDPNDPYYYNIYNNNQFIEEQNNEENINEEQENNINENGNENNQNENANKKYNIEDEEVIKDINNSEGDPERKDEVPLLIIDVNIKQGIKKKIYVYEGDTPEVLADKFAKEHNLEPETKTKLQSLIHSHMVKLLTRIDEENQSVSEKSQNVINNNNNNKNNKIN